jgi:peptidoglycan/LPS O-acetylase OafA/YrhL
VRAFDGLRGLAVLAVLLYHAQIQGMRGGFLGVSAFFTLSGFLITSLLLAEQERSGRISLKSFWSRRARRLLPAAYAAIAGVLIFGVTIATVDQARSLRADVLSTLAYVANWRFYFSGRSYAHLFSAPSPVLHFWSLAIEEQFYLLFPLLLVGVFAIARGRKAVVGAAFTAAIVASVVASNVLLASTGESRVYYGTDTRAAELLIGALLAIVFTRYRPTRRAGPVGTAVATVAGGAALATMVAWWSTVQQSDRWLYHGGFALHACLTAIVIACVFVDGPLSWLLSRKPIVALGLISYGVYLFHWPIYLWLSPERTGLSTWPLLGLRLAVTIPIAIASYFFLEQPIRHRRRLQGWVPKVVAPVSVAALALALIAVTWSPPSPQIVLTALGNTQSAVHVTPLPQPRVVVRQHTHAPPRPLHRPVAGARPLRVMVVGDSVGLTLGRGFELYARQHAGFTVDNLGHTYCPLGRTLAIKQGYVENTDVQACNWTTRWSNEVASFDPDVVVMLFTIWETSPRMLDGQWRAPGDPMLDKWQLSEYQAAADALSARGAPVVILTPPCEPNFKVQPGSPLWRIDDRLLPRVAHTRASVHLVDLGSQLCPHGTPLTDYAGVHNARPDGAHYSDAGALAVADWTMPIVLGQAPAPRAS